MLHLKAAGIVLHISHVELTCTVETHTGSVGQETLLVMCKNNCCELCRDLRVRALLLNIFMAGVWSVIISNVINTFSTGAAGGSAIVWVCVCVLCVRHKRDNYAVGLEEGCIFCHSHSSPNIYWSMMVSCICSSGAVSFQRYNYLVNILVTSIDFVANPISEAAIDPSASSPTISTLRKETLNTTRTIGSLTA